MVKNVLTKNSLAWIMQVYYLSTEEFGCFADEMNTVFGNGLNSIWVCAAESLWAGLNLMTTTVWDRLGNCCDWSTASTTNNCVEEVWWNSLDTSSDSMSPVDWGIATLAIVEIFPVWKRIIFLWNAKDESFSKSIHSWFWKIVFIDFYLIFLIFRGKRLKFGTCLVPPPIRWEEINKNAL